MWATVALFLGLFAVSWLDWMLAALLFIFYMSYLPQKRDSVRRWMPVFPWLRTQHCRLTYEGRLDVLGGESKARIFVFHPHGVHCVGATLLGSDPTMTHLRIACSSVLFWVPIVKEFAGWSGAFPCHADNIREMLKSNQPIVLYPGGLSEIPGADYLRPSKPRIGFLRIAMELGVDVVPCWVDGENDLYDVLHPLPWLQKLSYQLFRYPWPLISWGWKWVPFLPKAKKVTIRVGDPIATRYDGNIAVYEEQYRAALHKLK